MAAAGALIRALAREPQISRHRVEVVHGDLTVAETLDRCPDGINRVFLVWTAPSTAVARALERIVKHTQRQHSTSETIKCKAVSLPEMKIIVDRDVG
jgi:hypothetical protein